MTEHEARSTGPVTMTIDGRRYETVAAAAAAHSARLHWLCPEMTRSEVFMNRDAYGRPLWRRS